MERSLIHYDGARKRVWIRGQRCHHGATGALLATAGMIGLVALRLPALTAIVAGGVLMAHDWDDRTVWFRRGS